MQWFWRGVCHWAGIIRPRQIITHVVLGRTGRPWYLRWFGRSALDRLLATVPGVDVTLVDVR